MPSPPNRNLRFSSRSSSATSPNAATSFPAWPESASGRGDGGSSQIPSPDPAATATAAAAAPLSSRRGAAAADAEKAREDPSRRMAERTDDERVNAAAMAVTQKKKEKKRSREVGEGGSGDAGARGERRWWWAVAEARRKELEVGTIFTLSRSIRGKQVYIVFNYFFHLGMRRDTLISMRTLISPCFRVRERDHVIIGQCRPLSKIARLNVLKVILSS
uniref:Uncharacterized protein n=1 Tax=Oryza glumipatula TaxID=40148 RepID=A0A0D9YUW0_9ORYZ